ncbi:BtrH N-terminal domain-containing protein [Metasolibacillus meyeri]|uniref:BtrH N-terminal domain-containing protein n=1 Tax=Metasolibacillus meyeri TaxID=1071052 RepID=A0AAW9NMI0_9BACL|nr:BtrH N-terminal domain-containing protein [Metasolibacillus meyeri]MEC1178642.1 BtrH N-terminal domain-containing protein [Metasolibacillus meyeri]
MNFTVYRDPYQNCFQLVLSALLRREDIETEKLWYQIGLFYHENKDTFEIKSYYYDLNDFLKRNIDVNIKYIAPDLSSDARLEETIDNSLKKSKTIGISTDIYELLYCSYSQRYHTTHYIEVLDKQDDKYLVADHYYNYFDWVNKEIIFSGIKSYVDNNLDEEAQIFYIELGDEYSDDFDLLVSSLNNNYLSMHSNSDIYKNITNNFENTWTGLEAVSKIAKKLESIFLLENGERDNLLSKIYPYFKDIGNSRYQYYCFLKHNELSDLGEEIRVSGQNWNTITNMITRANIKNEYTEMIKRINEKFNAILLQEERITRILEKKLSKKESTCVK